MCYLSQLPTLCCSMKAARDGTYTDGHDWIWPGGSSSSLPIPGLESSAGFLRRLLVVDFRYLISSIVLVFLFGWRNTILFFWQLFKMSITFCLIFLPIDLGFIFSAFSFFISFTVLSGIFVFSCVLCTFLHFLIIVSLYPPWVLYIFFSLPSIV